MTLFRSECIYEAEGGGMGVSRADVDSVKWDMRALLDELVGKSSDTFPGADKEQQRFLDEVEAWATVPWDALAVEGAARRMAAMLPGLRAVCALKCANLWYTEAIHGIRGQIESICIRYEAEQETKAKRAERQAAHEAALAAAAGAAAAEARQKKQERRARVVEARASVTREARRWGAVKRQAPRVLTAEQSEAVRAVVQALETDVFALEELIFSLSREKLWCIEKTVAYLDSCSGDGTWIWNAEAWGAASEELTEARDTWQEKWYTKNDVLSCFKSLSDACDACIRDMQQYKALCGGATPWYRSMFGLEAQLDALKELAEV